MRVAGTGNALGLVLTRFTVSPPAGAKAFRVTVPVTICPPVAFSGLRLNMSEDTTGGLIVRFPTFWLPLSVAEIVAIVRTETGTEATRKDALVDPAGTVTVGGTSALPLVLASATVVPPAAAGPPNVTVAVAGWPPTTVPGETVRVLTCSGWRVKGAEAGLFKVPVMVTVVCVVTGDVKTEKVPVVWPAGMGTLESTNVARFGALLDIWTTAGVIGALVRVTVPVTVCAPSTVVGGPSTTDCTADEVVGSTVSGTDPDDIWPPTVTAAEMCTVVCAFTAVVFTVNMVEVAPAATANVGLGRMTTSGLSVESVAVSPPAGTAGEKVTMITAD